MPLAAAQDFFSANGMISSYILSLSNTKDPGSTAMEVSTALGKNYEVMTWEEMMPDIRQHIETDSNNMQYVQGVLYLLICFGIFSTLLMMMAERKFEMGMLVAVGMQKYKLMLLLLMESVLTVFAGCVTGIAASIPLVYSLKDTRFEWEVKQQKRMNVLVLKRCFPLQPILTILFTRV